MEFQTTAQEACYQKISPWMKEIFGEFALERDDIPAIGITVGSALAIARVWPMGEDDATITVRAYVVTDVELTADLMEFLLRKNADMRFGAFGIDEDGDIVFEHSIVGSTCDKEELRASTVAVVMTADKYDDEIVSRWGGRRAVDR